MKRALYTILSILALVACQQSEHLQQGGECILELEVARAGKPSVTSRAVDADLAVTILDANGEEYLYYPAGTIPKKIVLEPGEFTVCAHTDNQTTWHTANGGKGEPCYFASQQVEMEYDYRTRITMSVPMTNYAVGVGLPEFFDDFFNSHQFILKSGSREVAIQEGEKAYFDLSDGGFYYALSATNTDGVSHTHSPVWFFDVQGGKHYLLRYHYASNANSGSVDIEITDDMGTDDTYIDL